MRKLLFIFFLYFSCNDQNEHYLNIAAAANIQFALQEIVESFTKETGIKCKTIVSSSGKLTAQIKEGAPFDIFLSADMRFPDELYNYKLTEERAKVYAFGNLVLWTMENETDDLWNLLEKSDIKKIALANPKTAPYGVAVLESLKEKGIYEKLKKKFVYGESIAQTNQFILSKAAQIGFTAKSVVLSPNVKEKGIWQEVNQNLYSPINQGVVVLKNKRNMKHLALQFESFLFSKKGKEILNKFGYQTNF